MLCHLRRAEPELGAMLRASRGSRALQAPLILVSRIEKDDRMLLMNSMNGQKVSDVLVVAVGRPQTAALATGKSRRRRIKCACCTGKMPLLCLRHTA